MMAPSGLDPRAGISFTLGNGHHATYTLPTSARSRNSMRRAKRVCKSFLIVEEGEKQPDSRLNVVVNCFEELERLVPTH